jgi:ELWxxDGT repeat protein
MASKILFRAVDATHGTELWVTDGTAVGTYLVKDMRYPITTGSATAGLAA